MRWVFNEMKCKPGVNQNCLSKNRLDPAKCMFAEHSVPSIETPLFAMQSRYDSWQIQNILGVDKGDSAKINQFGENFTRIFLSTVVPSGSLRNGAFLDSCLHHCYFGKNNIMIDGVTANQAFAEFTFDRSIDAFYFQKNGYPCDQCCPAAAQIKKQKFCI